MAIQIFKLDQQTKAVLPKSVVGAVLGMTVPALLAEAATRALNLQGNNKLIVTILLKLILGLMLVSLGATGKFGGMLGTVAGFTTIGSIFTDILPLLGVAGGIQGLARSFGAKVRGVSRTSSRVVSSDTPTMSGSTSSSGGNLLEEIPAGQP